MNTFGTSFRVTTFGESHGPCLGVIIDGCPPGVSLKETDFIELMSRRRPGTGPLVSPRNEEDRVIIASGVFEEKTTGTPIALIIRNNSMNPGDYDLLKTVFRPGHADFTYYHKYGIRDHRGGGRSSGRETAARVAAGVVALRCISGYGIIIESKICEIHGTSDEKRFQYEIIKAKEQGDSVGGIIEVKARGCPPGLGDPVFGKLDALIAWAMMSIGSVKGVEIGNGFLASKLLGSENNDQITEEGFCSNNAGGILGGISTGQDIIARLAIKPTPSIDKEQNTVDIHNKSQKISIGGRHDPCIVPRVLVVAESMLALVLADALINQKKIIGLSKEFH